MTTAVQVQYRRDSAANVAAFTGAAGEMIIDTTNNRVVVQDGATAGGFPAAKLAEVVTNTRTQVSDGNYTALTTDRTVAYIALTASRVVSLPAASTFPGGSRLLVVDESGNCSASKTVTLSAAGSDLIDGASSAVINSAYGYLALESNTANKWTIVDQASSSAVPSINGLTGAITIVANDGDVVTASGSTVTLGGPGGMVNKFRNGTVDVWQRGTSGTATTSAGAATQTAADGWYVVPTGASVAWAQAGGRLLTKNSLQVTGAASVTDLLIKQRIESLVAAAFCSQTVTVQAQVYNGTGGPITPTLTVNHAGSQDVWTSPSTDVSAVSLQSCPASAWTLISYTFSASSSSYNGLEIIFDFGNNFGANTKTVQITECDIRVTPAVSTGLNFNPPPRELRPVAQETIFCQRYYYRRSAQSNVDFIGTAQAISSSAINFIWPFPTVMRAAPTVGFASQSQVTSYNGSGNPGGACTALSSLVTPTPYNAPVTATGMSGLSAGNASLFWFNTASGWIDASAEL